MSPLPVKDPAQSWTGVAVRGWIELQPQIDAMFEPLNARLTEGIAAEASILDIGCGSGATTFAAAAETGSGRCMGVDVSKEMIESARSCGTERPNIEFHCADAQDFPFPSATFDRVISRFGVMFFRDPEAAFANLRRALKPDTGELRFIAWRGMDENPFMTAAERAAAPFFPDIELRAKDAKTGQFAFAAASRVRAILEASGWKSISIEPLGSPCEMPESALVPYITSLGPLSGALRDRDAAFQAQVIAAVRPAFDGFVHAASNTVQFNAACWLVSARA